MANIMSQKNVRNKVHRNGFDLSFRNSFTAKVGELLPVMCKEIIPGDHYDIDVSSFTRTQPVNSAAFSRLREYYDFYFVPYSLLWDKFNALIIQTNNPYHAQNFHQSAQVDTMPYMDFREVMRLLNAVAYYSKDGDSASYVWKNDVGVSRFYGTCKLLSYLGYGNMFQTCASWFENPSDPSTFDVTVFKKLKLNPFPLMAYQKIYQDYFRFSQWEKAAPWTYNCDYLLSNSSGNAGFNVMGMEGHATGYTDFINTFYEVSGLTPQSGNGVSSQLNMFDLRYCNYKKDLFMGVLPSPQFGDTAVAAPITGSFTGLYSFWNNSDGTIAPGSKAALFSGNPKANLMAEGAGKTDTPYLNLDISAANVLASMSGQPAPINTAGISVFALRQAEFLQKWKEITNSGSLDYREQIQKHWGVTPDKSESYLCRWLGGTSGNITINEVVNQNLTSASSEANLFGKAAGSVNGHISETFNQYGILMCIYHCEPVLDWSHVGLDRLNSKTQVGDFAIPEFDSLGMESLPFYDLCFTQDSGIPPVLLDELGDAKPLGYVPRYIEYKTSYDQINGSFLTSMAHWVNPLTLDDITQRFFDTEGNSTVVDYSSFKVSPSVVNSIFAVNADNTIDSDCLLIGSFFDIKAVRNLSVSGLPY